MNKSLFEHQETLDDDNLKAYAKALGLDGEEMLRDVYAGKFDAVVEKGRREGLALGIESTPSLFIDGRANVLPPKAWYLAFTVEDEIAWKKEKGWKFAAPQGRAGR
jgi:protein-disulfide isomerase